MARPTLTGKSTNVQFKELSADPVTLFTGLDADDGVAGREVRFREFRLGFQNAESTDFIGFGSNLVSLGSIGDGQWIEFPGIPLLWYMLGPTNNPKVTEVYFLAGLRTATQLESLLNSMTYKSTAVIGSDVVKKLFFELIMRDERTDEAVGRPDLTATITIKNVPNPNDAPSGADKTITVLEDATHSFTAGDFGFSDTNGHKLQSVLITALPAEGSLTLAGASVIVGQQIPASMLQSLRWTPPADGHGADLASVEFKVVDTGGTANGGIDTDPTANTITFDVTAVNDAPSGIDKTVSLSEDGSHTFDAGDFGFTDTEGDHLSAIRIVAVPKTGTLTLDGQAVKAGQVVAAADIGDLVWTPDANDNGAGLDSLTFKVIDDGGTANGGADTDRTPNTITFDVGAENDAPVVARPLTDDAAVTGKTFSFTIPAGAFKDIDGDTLSFTAADMPSWMSFDAATRTFSGVPSESDIGSSIIRVTASDGTASVEDTFGILVVRAGGTAVELSSSFVDENAAANTVIGEFFGLDGAGNNYRYSLTKDDPDNAFFAIGNNTLVVAAGAKLDFETRSEYEITLRVRGEDVSTFDLTLTIHLNDIVEDPRGTKNDDILVGDALDNVIDGKAGNDMLTGLDGADRFVFGAGYGRDTILDFDAGEGDTIDLSNAAGIDSFIDLTTNHVADAGANLRITAADGSVLVIRNIEVEALAEEMFSF